MAKALKLFAAVLPVLFACPVIVAAPLTYQNGKQNVNRSLGVNDPRQYRGDWAQHKYFPSPENWNKFSIYQVILDRFRDGNPLNNTAGYADYDAENLAFRQGGDFAGLTQKLDYIKGLGFDVVSISPIFLNTRGSPAGYEPIDLTLIDDRFGTLDEFRKLINEAHRREMYILVDMVVADLGHLYEEEGFKDRTAPFKFHKGEYRLIPREDSETYLDFKVDNNFVESGAYCDVYDSEGARVVDGGNGSYWNSDFYHNGAARDQFDVWQNFLGRFSGRDRLRLCSESVQEKLIAITNSLIRSTDVDGIKIIDPGNIPRSFLSRYAPAVRAHAHTLGKKNFIITGDSGTSKGKADVLLAKGKYSTMRDQGHEFIDQSFALNSILDEALYKIFFAPQFQNYGVVDVKEVEKFANENKNAEASVIFFGGADKRRLGILPDGAARLRQAIVLAAFWPGMPYLFQGDEQNFSHLNSGKRNVASANMMASIGDEGQAVDSEDHFNMSGESYLFIQKIMQIRQKLWPLLSEDGFVILDTIQSSERRLLSFSRGTGAQKLQVVLNMSPGLIRVSPKLRAGCGSNCSLIELLSGAKISSDAEGMIQSEVFGPYDIKLYYNGEVPQFSPKVVSVEPRHESHTKCGENEISVTFDAQMNAESVKKALRFNGRVIDTTRFKMITASKFSIIADAVEGINLIELDSKASSLEGVQTARPFASRFQCGGPHNPIINRTSELDRTLVNNGQQFTASQQVTLYHKARGAKLFRVRNGKDGQWSNWTPFQERSDWALSGDSEGWQEITVQYWVDGSGAYFSKGGIDYLLGAQ